jgi:hypothetical protein
LENSITGAGCVAVYDEAEKLGCQLVRLLRVATKREENAAVAVRIELNTCEVRPREPML